MDEGWGPGNRSAEELFDKGQMDDGTKYELIFGEHPHSRNDNNIYARFEDGSIEGFDGHRTQVEIRMRTFNYLKCSGLSGNEVRRSGQATIAFNGRPVHALTFRDPVDVLLRLRSVLLKLFEFPVDWRKAHEPGSKEMVGRKIYYRNTPAVITSWDPEEGSIMIEEASGRPFPKMCWEDDDSEERRMVKDDVFSSQIWWFRKEAQ